MLYKLGIAECNGDVKSLIGNSETAVCPHVQYKFGQKH